MPTPSPPRRHPSHLPTSHVDTQPSYGQEKEPLRYPDTPVSQTTTLPPVTTLTGYTAGRPLAPDLPEQGSPAARPLGVHNILNPATEDDRQRVSRSPVRGSSGNHGSQALPGLISPRIRKRQDTRSPFANHPPVPEQRHGRRMLTPKSPSLRSLSQAVRDSPSLLHASRAVTGPHDSRSYFVEPGESASSIVPPLPALPQSFQPALMHPSNPLTHTAGMGGRNPHVTATTYSTGTQGYPESPSGSSNYAEREDASPYHAGADSRHPMLSNTRDYAGHSSYQMQLSTEQGTMIVPVEVDIQQASKLADEKRKRNAGASARFRQRRKEKEQAAAATIADLQRQIRELSEDRDFYMGERNALRDFISRTAGIQVPPRPSSPRRRRSQLPGQYASGQADVQAGTEYTRGDPLQPSPAQRRRTSDYQPSFAGQNRPPVMHPQYAPGPTTPYSLPPPQSQSLQAAALEPQQPGGIPPSQPGHFTPGQAVVRRPPFDPLRPEPHLR